MEVEIKVMWCKGLTSFNFFQKLTVYAAVSLISEDEKIQLTQDQKQEQKTPVDENGEGNPEWNSSMKFDLRPLHIINPNMNGFGLQFELRTKGQLFGDKIIGEVSVPLIDLIQSVGFDVVRFVKYEVRSPDGKPNGILDFSYKVIGNNDNVISSNNDVQITGYHHHHHHHHHHHRHHDLYQSHDQQLNESHTNSEIHVVGYQHHNHNDNNNMNVTYSTSNSEMIQYPNINLNEEIPIVLASPLLYPPSLSSSSSSSSSPYYYYSSSSSFTSTNATHYQPSSPLYPPPSSQTWAPATTTPPPPSHYPPPPLQQPYTYPPPSLQHQPQGPQPFGDARWGYRRSDSYHQW